MTPESPCTDRGNALDALKSSARRTRDSRLVGAEAAGLLFSLAVWICIPARWPVALPFLALSAYGIWGVTDHALIAGRSTMSDGLWHSLRCFRGMVGIAGAIAGVLALYLIVGKLVGTVVS